MSERQPITRPHLCGRRATVALIAVVMAAIAPSGATDAAEARALNDCSGFMSAAAAPGSDARTGNEARVANVTLGGVPAILRMPARVTQPPVLLWHGFGPPDSEKQLMQALPLDEVPAVKVYLGLPLFGSRAPAGGMQELARRQQEDLALQVFEPVVIGAVKELPKVVEALAEGRCMQAGERVAVIGFSAGGAAVLAALAEHPVPIDAAVTINASTGLSDSVGAYERATGKSYAWSERSRALAARSDAVKRAPDIARDSPALLLLHGTEDSMLTAESVLKLHDVLRPLYAQAGATSQLRLRLIPGLQHSIASSPAAQSLNQQIAQWLRDQRPSDAK